MTQPDDRDDLPPEQDAVRRLLADARHDEPVPPAVAARLDAVLAELTADRREVRKTAPVLDLAARRRRGAGMALLAAAAVVVAGVGIGQVLGGGGDMDDGATAGGDSDGSAESFSSGESGAETPSDAADEDPVAESGRQNSTAAADLPAVSSDTLRRDLRAALRAAALVTAAEPDPTCALAEAALGDGTPVPVTLDGQPALALYAVPKGSRQRVDVYLCGTAVPAETVTLPVR